MLFVCLNIACYLRFILHIQGQQGISHHTCISQQGTGDYIISVQIIQYKKLSIGSRSLHYSHTKASPIRAILIELPRYDQHDIIHAEFIIILTPVKFGSTSNNKYDVANDRNSRGTLTIQYYANTGNYHPEPGWNSDFHMNQEA